MSIRQSQIDTVLVGDRRIAFEAPNGFGEGRGQLVLLVHGASADKFVWASVVSALARHHRPVALSLPGHGDSEGPAVDDVDGLVKIVKGLHDALGLGQIVLVGHSMGGAIAQRYYSLHRDDIVAVGLISTAPNFHMPQEVVAGWIADPASYRAAEVEMVFSAGTGDAVKTDFLAVRDSLPPQTQEADLRACASWNNPDPFGIEVPTLVMTADDDVESLQEQAVAWASHLPNSTLSKLPAASHMLTIEQPDLVARAIVDWVDSL